MLSSREALLKSAVLCHTNAVLDLHCHILPAVDDGSSSWEMSLEMGRCLVEAGFTVIAPSPHYGTGPGGDVSMEVAEAKRGEIRELFEREGIELEILPNAEHHVSPMLFDRLKEGAVVPIGGVGKWLLVELPWSPMVKPEEILFRLQMSGHRLLLAHPERYNYLEVDTVERLVERGVKLQLELGSCVGVYGRRSKKRARLFADKGWSHVIASDLHRPETWLGDALKAVEKRYGTAGLKKALEENPQAILSDIDTEQLEPFLS